MEEERKKSSRWAESLGEAGLLDEIEDSWSLPPGPPVEGSTITVEGSGHGRDDADRPTAPGDGGNPPLARPTRPAVKKPQAQQPQPGSHSRVPGAKQTMSGIPSAPPRRLTNPPDEEIPLIELEPVEQVPARSMIELEADDELRDEDLIELEVIAEPASAAGSLDHGRDSAAVVSVRGARISVPPDRPDPLQPAQPEIIDQPLPPVEPEKPVRQQMTERYELGDYSGALQLAEQLLRDDPDDVEAVDCAGSCKEVLIRMYEARIGSFDRMPQVAISAHELIWRDLDPAAGFVLSRIDGYSSFEDVIDISGMGRFETCRILSQLLQEGIIK